MKTTITLSTALKLISVVLLFSTASLILAESDKPVFRAGAALSNITPPLGELIVGPSKSLLAAKIHDELHARCLVLDDGKAMLAIVLCDNVGIPVEIFDLAKRQIQESTGIPASHMLMAATHTHSATTARGPSKTLPETNLTDYQRFLAHRIVTGVQQALEQLEPARIAWGKVDEPSEVFNRRWFIDDESLRQNPFGGIDQVRMNPPRGSPKLIRPAGPIDPEISFLSVQSLGGRPIALLANYSLHYVGGVAPGDVSADYFGYFAKYIEEKLGATNQSPPFVGILSNGTSGDVNNINFTENKPRLKHYEKMKMVAGKVASRVFEAHLQVTFQDWVPLGAQLAKLTLKTRQPTPEMLAHIEKLQHGSAIINANSAILHANRIAKIQQAPKEVHVPLQALRIGDLGILALPFETFAETGLELKARSPFGETFTIELANGSYGYLPTPEQHELGGYETWLGTNYVEKEASTKIVTTLLELLQGLQ